MLRGMLSSFWNPLLSILAVSLGTNTLYRASLDFAFISAPPGDWLGGLAWLGSAWVGSVWLGSAWLGSDRLGSARSRDGVSDPLTRREKEKAQERDEEREGESQ